MPNQSPVFIGCGFAAKYPMGGGNFSVPLQYLLGLKRLGRLGIWLEVLTESGDAALDAQRIRIFSRRMKQYDLRFCLLLQPKPEKNHPEEHHLEPVFKGMKAYGMDLSELQEMAKHSTLLNLSYSIKPPLTNFFERRLLCSLDPSEVLYWMSHMEMGQSSHDEFWSVGLCMDRIDPRLPKAIVPWKSFFPLVDTEFLQPQPKPLFVTRPRFTTIGQWYWDGMLELGGDYIDFSKQAAFAPYLDLPGQVPEAIFELAMNLNPDDPERGRLKKLGWHVVSPHRLTPTPQRYYDYLAGSLAEFTAVKLESKMQSGWLSDRAAAYLAMGRPVITESTGAEQFLPEKSGLLFANNLAEAIDASRRVLLDWPKLSCDARAVAIEYFDAAKTLKKMLAE
ncbi:MAG: glycosyltransferase [Chthoniobacterales bacterium]